jgi:hypothetical protein
MQGDERLAELAGLGSEVHRERLDALVGALLSLPLVSAGRS